jgi:manganese/zinc/iron transport system permease protein
MAMVSITAVGAFDHVGAILVVALMIAPAATAYLLTNELKKMIWLSVLIGALSAITGYWISKWFNVNVSGMIATMTGLVFLLTLICAPERGLIARRIEAVQRRKRFAVEMLVYHLRNHEDQPDAYEENSVAHLVEQLRWQADFAQATVRRAGQEGLIERQNGHLTLTPKGRTRALAVANR